MKVPQSVDCLPPAQKQTAEAPLSWVIGKLCAVPSDIFQSIHIGSGVKSLMYRDQGCGGVNAGVFVAEVLITLVKPVGYGWL